MADRCELMEAALEGFPEGLALLDTDGVLKFWNHAAEHITGFPSMEAVKRTVPWGLEPLAPAEGSDEKAESTPRTGRYRLIRAQHRAGHDLPLLMRTQILRDGLGRRIGTAAVFHVADGLDMLPHGESLEEPDLESAQADIEEQAKAAFEDFTERGVPLGLLWITVDQAHEMRSTHGARACATMLERIERTLTHGLHPAEELGRWGDDEFLVLAHEATAAELATHGQALAWLARTSDFRWWGDRLSITVSIGAAQARREETLPELFARAQAAMVASVHAGGNHITLAAER